MCSLVLRSSTAFRIFVSHASDVSHVRMPLEYFFVSFLGKFVHWNNSVLILSAGTPNTTLLLPIHDIQTDGLVSAVDEPVLWTRLGTDLVQTLYIKWIQAARYVFISLSLGRSPTSA